MKNNEVEFIDEHELGFRPRHTWSERIKSSILEALIKSGLAKNQYTAYIIVLIITVLIFIFAAVIFLLTPPPVDPSQLQPSNSSGLIAPPRGSN